MWTIKIYFLRTEDKREAASSDRLPPASLEPHATGLPRAGRHARASGPGRAGQKRRFLSTVEVELIVRVLEKKIQKYCMNFAIVSVVGVLGKEATAIGEGKKRHVILRLK